MIFRILFLIDYKRELEEIIVRRWVGSLAVSTFVSVSKAGILLWKVRYTSTADEYILQLRMNIYFNCE